MKIRMINRLASKNKGDKTIGKNRFNLDSKEITGKIKTMIQIHQRVRRKKYIRE